ncbi:MAG TPA: glutathione-regulated potassium-efflux system protein KefC [Polyangiaceae bacterium]|nr:glutathione-regulated potassium-efflux system protein KefC [Polyangiaceae bacterium]
MSDHGLLFDTMVYLAAAVLFVPLAARFKLGSVLGYLLAGCVIGPYCLRLVRDVESILHFAEFGVVLMLFTIGLELDPKRLWGLRGPVFGGGALQLGVCGSLLALGAWAVGLPWQAALVAGLALALSSTAIAVQTMRERHLLEAPLGRAGFSVLLFQDIAAIPLVALVPLLAGGKTQGGVLAALKVLAAILFVIVAGRYLTRPLMRIMARTGMREVFTGFSLLLVVAISELMDAVGVSMALGAFLAGVVLAGSEYRHALETDIEPFKGLLLGLFFIAVGMSINFGLLSEQPLLIGSLVAGLTAFKGAGLYAIASRLGVPRTQRGLFALLLAQGSEFGFVVFGVASRARLLPGKWDEMLTLVVALSMALTPLLLLASDRFAKGSAGEERPDDVIEHHHAPVIIAGFGRFGQIVGRLLFASGIRATVLDHDPDQIEILRRFGFRIFYGDATRLDLLHSAGAAQAKLLVIALDDMAASIKLAELAEEHFPHLRIIARARNVAHYVKLRQLKIRHVERETFESALRVGRRTLEHLGVAPYEARERADRFRLHNVQNLEEQLSVFGDESRRLSLAKAARAQLEAQFSQDAEALAGHGGEWHPAEDDRDGKRPLEERVPAARGSFRPDAQ